MAEIRITLTEEQQALRKAVYDLCQLYPGAYWRELDEKREYPEAFVQELTKAGYLAALIPEAYGGGGLGILEYYGDRAALRLRGAKSALSAAHC